MKNKVLALMALLLCTMAVNAQEKAMCVQMNDSSSTLTRVAELKKITFLSIADKGKALLVNTIGGNLIVKVRESRVAISREMAAKIFV